MQSSVGHRENDPLLNGFESKTTRLGSECSDDYNPRIPVKQQTLPAFFLYIIVYDLP